jgi:hypothetical protein
MGDPVIVTSHAYAQAGVTEILLAVNGTEYRRESPSGAGAAFVEVTQEWVPAGPGEYALQVKAYDAEGNVSTPSIVRVRVLGEVATGPTATPTLAPSPLPGETAEPTDTPVSPTYTPLSPTEAPVAPTDTPLSPTDTPQAPPDTPWPSAQVSFSADSNSVIKGACTTLRWDVEYATTVLLDSAVVAAEGTQQVCPASTTTYHLYVTAPAGDVDRSVMVTVIEPTPTYTPEPTSPPADTTPPSITSITESDDPIRPPNCSPDEVIISANITDPSGVPKVDLHYRVVRGSEEGAWLWRPMNSSGGDVYETTIGDDQIKMSLFPYEGGATMEYYIKAWDSEANMTQSSTLEVTVIFCVP